MSTKVKGLLKGLRYITQKFDEGKEPEMDIGFPTDVKHVAHIGWDGPSVDTPSWMKEFRSQQGFQSAPLSANGEPKENPEVKWVSQDSCRRSSRSYNSPLNDNDASPKSTRRHSSADADGPTVTERPTRDPSTKSRQSRRSSNGSKTNRQPKDSSLGSDSSSHGTSDIPKKARQKKSKESVGGGSSRSSRSKANAPTSYTSTFSDPGADTESICRTYNGDLCQSSSLKPFAKEEDKECNEVS
ncbi:hypothetical protein RHMOL_Rhmol13G0046800 [Rhododendron molle]|uniref:Uncharacterized protein n=1 Tax=Rhododendron molle TaxID=49168 RepID=A0ACC0L3I7_RHOML|nr:hypothetical protein RHMOL_Rhmol13G0046800 [Rhododendron molle]